MHGNHGSPHVCAWRLRGLRLQHPHPTTAAELRPEHGSSNRKGVNRATKASVRVLTQLVANACLSSCENEVRRASLLDLFNAALKFVGCSGEDPGLCS